MAFPFLPLSLAFIAGLTVSNSLRPPLFFGVLGLLLCLSLAWVFYARRLLKLAYILILGGFFSFGLTHYTIQRQAYEANPLRLLPAEEYLDFEGKVLKSPAFTEDQLQLLLQTDKVWWKGEEKRIKGKIQVSFPLSPESSWPKIFVGDKVRVAARLLRDDDFSNFSPPLSLRLIQSRKIHRRAYSKSLLLLEKIDAGQKISPGRGISWVHRTLQMKIESHFSSSPISLTPEGAFLEAILLGDRGRLDEKMMRQLQDSGLFHLIAISGAHMAIISFFLFQLFKMLRFSWRRSSLLVIFALIFYSLLVEGRPSVVRASLMAILYLLGRLLGKDTHVLNSISLACFLILLFNPFQLVDAGFILTFMATLTIILFFPRWRRVLPHLPLRLTDLTLLSVSAQLGVMPFIAHSFHRVTLGSIILNLAAVPLIGLIMVGGWLFLLAASLSYGLGQFLSLGLKHVIQAFFFLTRLFEGVSLFSYRLPAPPAWVILGYFFCLFSLLYPRRFRWQRLALGLALTFFSLLLLTHPFPSSTKHLRVTFLDVGQGDSILVEFPGQKKMLIDGGGLADDSFDVGEHVVSPFLWRRSIKKLDYLVLSHPHPDHLNGLKAVVRNFRVKEFWEAVKPEATGSYLELMNLLSARTVRRQFFRFDEQNVGNFKIEFLHPPLKRTSGQVNNEDSMVILLKQERGYLLLTGDIGQESERSILEAGLKVQADILKSPHHGSRTSSSEAFLASVRPRLVVISAGRGNIYGVPHPDVLDRYEKMAGKVLRTDQDGAVEIILQDKELRVRTSRTRLDTKISLE